MSNFFDTVVAVLRQDERFFTAEGDLLRNAVYEAAMQMDSIPIVKFVDDNEYRIWGFHFFNQDVRMSEFAADMAKL